MDLCSGASQGGGRLTRSCDGGFEVMPRGSKQLYFSECSSSAPHACLTLHVWPFRRGKSAKAGQHVAGRAPYRHFALLAQLGDQLRQLLAAILNTRIKNLSIRHAADFSKQHGQGACQDGTCARAWHSRPCTACAPCAQPGLIGGQAAAPVELEHFQGLAMQIALPHNKHASLHP